MQKKSSVNFRFIGISTIVVLILLIGGTAWWAKTHLELAPTPSQAAVLAASSGAKLAFTNPACAAQPAAWSKSVITVKIFNGLVFTGCGDYGANTGPIDIYSFNPKGAVLTKEFTLRTEEIARYFSTSKSLYAVSIDPHEPNPVDFGFRDSTKPMWTALNSAGLAHNFDANSLTGSDIWFAGGAYNLNAAVIHSQDGGRTFIPADELQLPAGPGSYGIGRFYFVGKLGNRLYVESPGYTHASMFANGRWQETNIDLLPIKYQPYQDIGDYGSHPLEFRGSMFYLSSTYGQPAGRLYQFDGTTVRNVFVNPPAGAENKPIDLQVYNGALYVLLTGPQPQLTATKDLKSWQTVAMLPSSINPQSFDILSGTAYVGGAEGNVYSITLAQRD